MVFCRHLLSLHRTAVLRHDEYGQETLLNLLLRNYLHYNLYDQVGLFCAHIMITQHALFSMFPCRRECWPMLQAEKLRSKAQKNDVWRANQQLCRYLYYLGRIRAIQLDYTDAKDCLQQAARKVGTTPHTSTTYEIHIQAWSAECRHVQAPAVATGFRVIANKWLIVVRLLLGEIPEHSEFQQTGLQKPLAPYFVLTQAVRSGDLSLFGCVNSPLSLSTDSALGS